MIIYYLHQTSKTGNQWTSDVTFSADEIHHVRQAVIGGFIMGHARWATDAITGERLCGLDASGKVTT